MNMLLLALDFWSFQFFLSKVATKQLAFLGKNVVQDHLSVISMYTIHSVMSYIGTHYN